MIFALLDDATLNVHEDNVNLAVEYEAIDIENGEYSFFDSSGYELIPRMSQPTVRKKFLGLIPYSVDGTFVLTRGAPKLEEFIARLESVASVNENSWFKSVDDVRVFLTNQRRRV